MKISIEHGDGKKEVDIYSDEGVALISELYTKVAVHTKQNYEPTWLGVPIIQFPSDIVMMQELIWKLRPDVIVETGIAHGGSAIFSASILDLIGKGEVVCVDIDVRKYNEVAIRSHPHSDRVTMIEGSSIDAAIVDTVAERITPNDSVLVVLDSNHSKEHVLAEMEAYGKFISPGGYMVVTDGLQGMVHDIPWGKPEWKEDNPLAAIEVFLARHSEWEIDHYYERAGVTSNPSGYLRRRDSDKNG